ncbi:MAG: ArsR/SmtB family transcription factor [Geminicoccaceae bacterium]
MAALSLDQLLQMLRAAGEPSRLRLLAVCGQGEWTVSELTQILGQSQPRISRHLKLLADAGLLERFREGAWVFYRLATDGGGHEVAKQILALVPDVAPELDADRRRIRQIKADRQIKARKFFDEQAPEWDRLRQLTVADSMVEAAIISLFADDPPPNLLDVGTGTGRILQILSGLIGFGLGVDLSRDMLSVARANLEHDRTGNCQVRQGDMYQLDLPDESFAAVTLHQVLHFAEDPAAVIAEAARVLTSQGRLVVVDLAPHTVEQLRADHHHRRLGFSDQEIAAWFGAAGLTPGPAKRLEGKVMATVIWQARRTRNTANLAEGNPTAANRSAVA